MNRNAESHFATLAKLDIKRSKFDRSTQLKTTFNAGELIPIFVDEVLPGDTFTMDTACVIRMSTPIHPVMDNAFLDTYFFFVPNRLVWNHWKEFNGENTTTAWEQTTEYEIPQITSPTGGWQKGTIADYMGMPIGISNLSVSSLPFRAYVLIWNEWFRDQNLQDPAYLTLDDSTTTGTNGSTYQSDAQCGGKPLPVAKYHDYFTSALPEPQKGPAVELQLGDTAPVIGTGTALGITASTDDTLTWGLYAQENWGALSANSSAKNQPVGTQITPEQNLFTGPSKNTTLGLSLNPENSGVKALLSEATATTINSLRQAFQVQKLFERDARGGTRYTEIIKAHFGVTSPDGRQQRPEYLGGKRIPINVQQVLQTSATDETSPQGNTAAFSLTGDRSSSFTKSFTEHGFIIGLCCVRTEHTYQQGIERMWNRKRRFDFYWPEFANIGEQAILNKEIYAQGTDTDNEAFGYQEPWAEYRYKPSRVSGAFRSTYAQSLDVWHYGDEYTSLPVLSDTFIRETKANIDRTLAVQSSVEDQFIADFYFRNVSVRPMPVYSIPGLIDHN